jgi:hypothetical protein
MNKMHEDFITWVVYLRSVKRTNGIRAVCEQSEWDAMELAKPGLHQLIREGIGSEVEAERLARSEPTEVVKR